MKIIFLSFLMTPYTSPSVCNRRIDADVQLISAKKKLILDIIGQNVILTFFSILAKFTFSCHLQNLKCCALEKQVVAILNAIMVKSVSTDSRFIVLDLFLVYMSFFPAHITFFASFAPTPNPSLPPPPNPASPPLIPTATFCFTLPVFYLTKVATYRTTAGGSRERSSVRAR
jgi:hypothetical protein